MSHGIGWKAAMTGLVVALTVAFGLSGRAGEAAPGKGEPAKKPREMSQTEQAVAAIKRQIAEFEKKVKLLKEIKGSGKDLEAASFQDRMIEFTQKHMDLLREQQKALEANDLSQAKAVQEQIQNLLSDWQTYDEKSARIEAQRLAWSAKLAGEQNEQMRAAWDELIQVYDAVLKKTLEKRALEGELKDLDRKQKAAASKLEGLYSESQKRKAKEVKPKI